MFVVFLSAFKTQQWFTFICPHCLNEYFGVVIIIAKCCRGDVYQSLSQVIIY